MIEAHASAMIVSPPGPEIKVSPIPGASPDDPPAADPTTVRRSVHAASRSFGCCASFVGDSREAEGSSDAFPAADLGSLRPSVVLIPLKVFSIRLRMRWLRA
jgi:hypothetical protein